MKVSQLDKIIEKPITGEWGEDGGETMVLRTTNFTNRGEIDFKKIVTRAISEKKIGAKKLKIGDIIIEKSGGSPTQPVGRVVYFEAEGEYLCNNFTSILRPKKNLVFPKFLHYQLFAAHKFGVTGMFQNKTTGIINLQLPRYISKLEIPLPPLENQKRIAQILDDANVLRQKTEKLLEEYDTLAQSIFLDMFGDPVTNPMGWEKKPLKEFGNIITGNTPSRNDESHFSEKHIEWIKTDNISEKLTYVSHAREYLSKSGLKKGRFAKKGSLLVACIAGSIKSIGKACLTDRDVAFNQQINAIEPNSEVNKFFLFYLFKLSSKYIQNHASNGMKRMLSKGDFQKIMMIIPEITLQKKFFEKIILIEKQKVIAKQELAESEDLFNCLLQKAFKGELI